jgi:hypothetical protein
LTEPIRIFVSYSRKDQDLNKRLLESLSGLQREGLATIWHDRNIDAGECWTLEINNQLEIADIVLLLISPSFVSSNYCYGVELERAMERQSQGRAKVIPILLRPVDWGKSRLNDLQALPANGRPVTQWNNEDEAFQDISSGSRNVITRFEDQPAKVPVYESRNLPSHGREAPKYYLYISDSKVDMLFPQVPIATRMEIGAAFGIPDGCPLDERTEVDRSSNRIFKLQTVVRFLREGAGVGSIDEPKEYFTGSANVFWGQTHVSMFARNRNQPYIYFTGHTERTTFLLSASSKYLIAGNQPQEGGFSSSSIPQVIDSLSAEIDLWSDSKASAPPTFEAWKLVAHHERKDLPYRGPELALDLVDMARRHLSGVEQSLEFFAKTLLRGPSPAQRRQMNILGSPLYVALVL